MRIPDARIEALLDRSPVARLATLGLEGRPHLVPIVFARVGGSIWSPIDGKPKSESLLARVRNLRQDARASLLIDRYDPDWTRLWWIRLDGLARPVELAEGERSAEASAPHGRGPEGEVERALEALRGKYPQYRTTPLLRASPTLIELRIDATRSWCAAPGALDDPV